MFYKIRAKTESKKNEVRKISEDTFEVSVKAEPKEGMANDAILTLMGEWLKVNPKRLKIIKGSKSPSKIIKLLE